MRPFHLTLVAATFAGTAAFAAGSGSSEAPKPTATTTTCKDGKVWDETSSSCVEPVQGRLDDDTLYGAAREFAYAGQYGHALAALDAMSDQSDDRVLTYRGFANRRAGRIEEGMAFYAKALARNPDNLLARSYRGQGYVEQGEIEMAKAELSEIVARGGAGGWPEVSLRRAIATGVTYSF